MASFDDLWNQTPAEGEAPSFDQLWSSTPATPSGLNAAAGQIGKGLALGWFDELQGLEAGARNSILNVFGAGNDKGFWDNYQATVDPLRARDAAYEQAHPYGAPALQMTGALIPALVTSGASALTGEAAALDGLGGLVGRNLFGVGFEEAPSLFQLGKLGATSGAVAGAGEANGGDRLYGAGVGGTVGAVTAPILGKALEYGVTGAGNALANQGIDPYALFSGSRASQRGSFSGAPKEPFSYTPEELILAQQLKNTPIDKVRAGALELAQASEGGTPLFLPEAVESAKVDRNARFIANYEPSMEFSQGAIKGRTAGAEERGVGLLSSLSEETSPHAGATRLAKAAGKIIGDEEAARQDIAKPLYAAAYESKPEIQSEELSTLIRKDKTLQKAINGVREHSQYVDLPDNSTELLVKARGRLGDKIETAKTQGRAQEARDLTDTYNKLNDILHGENPELAAADFAYSTSSGRIEKLTETFLGSLRNFTGDKIQNISQIFNLPAESIAKLRKTFADKGLIDEWNAGIRAHLQTTIESSKEGRNFTDKLIGNTIAKGKLEAALADAYDPVVRGLEYENRMFVGKNKYHTGSSTYGNLAEDASFKEMSGFLGSLKKKDWAGALAAMFSTKMPEKTAQGLARIYFDPKTGASKLKKILPLLEQYAKNQIAGEMAGKAGGVTAARESGLSADYGARGQSAKSQAGQGGEIPLSELFPGLQESSGQSKKLDQSSKLQSSSKNNNLKPVSTQDGYEGYYPGLNRNVFDVLPRESMADKSLLKSVAIQESATKGHPEGNPRAIGPETKYGRAKGKFQFLDATGKEMMQRVGLDPKDYDPFNPDQQEVLANAYIDLLTKQFGSLPLALAAYNYGPGNVSRMLKKYGASSYQEIEKHLPQETRKYVPAILGRLNKDTIEV